MLAIGGAATRGPRVNAVAPLDVELVFTLTDVLTLAGHKEYRARRVGITRHWIVGALGLSAIVQERPGGGDGCMRRRGGVDERLLKRLDGERLDAD